MPHKPQPKPSKNLRRNITWAAAGTVVIWLALLGLTFHNGALLVPFIGSSALAVFMGVWRIEIWRADCAAVGLKKAETRLMAELARINQRIPQVDVNRAFAQITEHLARIENE